MIHFFFSKNIVLYKAWIYIFEKNDNFSKKNDFCLHFGKFYRIFPQKKFQVFTRRGLLGYPSREVKTKLWERVCCLLVLNLVSSTLSCIRQPRKCMKYLQRNSKSLKSFSSPLSFFSPISCASDKRARHWEESHVHVKVVGDLDRADELHELPAQFSLHPSL